jgi:hypothetical protein
MAYRLEMLEQALARMREHLAERREKRDAMVAERVEGLMQATTQPAGQPPPHPRGEDIFGPPGPPGPPGEGGPPDQPPPP